MSPVKGGKHDVDGQDGPVKGAAAGGSTGGRGRVRRATFDDLDAILDINDNIYDGTDYVPALFYIFMQSKQYTIYVYELDGQLNYLPYRLTDRHQLATFSTLSQYSNPRTKPTMLSYTEGSDWLKRSEQLVNFLSRFAEDYMVAGAKWLPVKINAIELRKVFTDNIVFVSFAGTKGKPVDGNLILMPSTDERSAFGENDEIAGFSSSNIFQCKYGVNFEIQFYGDSEVDLLSHVYSHILHYVSVMQDDVRIAFSLHFPLSIDSNNVRERLKEELGDIYRSEFFSVTQVVHYIAPFDPPLAKK